MNSFYVLSKGEVDTSGVAAVVASYLRPGDVVVLAGTLACGKTHFVKALASALGSSDLVTSPTYAIVHTYNTKIGDLLHVDVYRLSGIREFRDLGLDEFLEESITVIEWGDKVRSEFDSYLDIAFDLAGSAPDHRGLTFSGVGGRWIEVISSLKSELDGQKR